MNLDKTKIRAILNMLFIIGAILSIVFYFTINNQQVYLYTCGAALVLKMTEVIMRMIRFK